MLIKYSTIANVEYIEILKFVVIVHNVMVKSGAFKMARRGMVWVLQDDRIMYPDKHNSTLEPLNSLSIVLQVLWNVVNIVL